MSTNAYRVGKQVGENVFKILGPLEAKLDSMGIFDEISRTTRLKKSHVMMIMFVGILGCAYLILGAVLFDFFGLLLTTLLPLVLSIQSLPDSNEGDTRAFTGVASWLCYWIVHILSYHFGCVLSLFVGEPIDTVYHFCRFVFLLTLVSVDIGHRDGTCRKAILYVRSNAAGMIPSMTSSVSSRTDSSAMPLDGAACPIWRLPSFAAEFGDAYIALSGLENSRLLWSAQILGKLIARLYRKKTYFYKTIDSSNGGDAISDVLRAISYCADRSLLEEVVEGSSARKKGFAVDGR
eukprot:g2966.t1